MAKGDHEQINILLFKCSICHFTWRLVYCCCWQHRFSVKVLLCNSHYFCIGDSDMQLNNTHRKCCSVFAATMVSLTCHSFLLYVHSPSCYFQQYLLISMFVAGHGHFSRWSEWQAPWTMGRGMHSEWSGKYAINSLYRQRAAV